MAILSEEQIRVVAHFAKEELGEGATLERLREVVRSAVKRMEEEKSESLSTGQVLIICISFDGLRNSRTLSDALKDTGCKISERFEKKLAELYVLTALIQQGSCAVDLTELRQRLSQAGNEAGVRVIVQSEDTLRNNTNV